MVCDIPYIGYLVVFMIGRDCTYDGLGLAA